MLGNKNNQQAPNVEAGNNNNQQAANTEAESSNSQQAPAAAGKEFTYRCVETCTYGGRFYREGDTLVLPEKREVPHFEFAEEKTSKEES